MKLTDGSRALLKLQRANLERSSPLLSTNTHVSIERLLWGEDLETHAQGAWDIVLGADVTYAYDPNAHDALAATFAALLDVARRPPRIILAHEHRNRGPAVQASLRWDEHDETLRRFGEAAHEHGLCLEQLVWEKRTPEAAKLLESGLAVPPGCHECSIIEVTRA